MKVYVLLKRYLIDFDYGNEIIGVYSTIDKAQQKAGKLIDWKKRSRVLFQGWKRRPKKFECSLGFIIQVKTIR